MHPTDAALFAATPLLPAPRFGVLPELAEGHKRLLGGSSGLYVEARTSAWDVCLPVAAVPMPYGDVQPRLRCEAGAVPRALVEAFIAEAKAQSHREIAAAIVLDDGGEFELRWPEIETSSAGHVRYIDSDIDDDRLVIDLHSHAGARAFFSQQDDRSDGSRRGPYLAMVIGRCADDVPEVATRLVLPPHLIPLSPDVLKAFEVFA
jgi:PRTRC genetic system protein A